MKADLFLAEFQELKMKVKIETMKLKAIFSLLSLHQVWKGHWTTPVSSTTSKIRHLRTDKITAVFSITRNYKADIPTSEIFFYKEEPQGVSEATVFFCLPLSLLLLDQPRLV